MTEEDEEDLFDQAFIRRTAELRARKFRHQKDMAFALRIPLATYKKYETRSPLPPRLHLRFCKIVGVELDDLHVAYLPGAIRHAAKPLSARGKTEK